MPLSCGGQVTLTVQKIRQNLATSNPKQDLHNINVQTKFRKNPLPFTLVIVRK